MKNDEAITYEELYKAMNIVEKAHKAYETAFLNKTYIENYEKFGLKCLESLDLPTGFYLCTGESREMQYAAKSDPNFSADENELYVAWSLGKARFMGEEYGAAIESQAWEGLKNKMRGFGPCLAEETIPRYYYHLETGRTVLAEYDKIYEKYQSAFRREVLRNKINAYERQVKIYKEQLNGGN